MEIKYSEYENLDSSIKPSVGNDAVYWEQDAPKKSQNVFRLTTF